MTDSEFLKRFSSAEPIKIRDEGPILVVDDNTADLELCKWVFEASAVKNELKTFSDGPSVLQFLNKVQEGVEPMPALMLLDINMPGMDGLQVVEAIRSSDFFQTAPLIIMLTASNDYVDMEAAKRNGANDYQVKPFGIDEYIEFITTLKSPEVTM